MGLSAKTCVPCQGGIPPLGRDDVQRLLLETPGWLLSEDGARIRRTFRFPDFAQAMGFAVCVGNLAEAEDHHPDISFGWGYVTVVIFTHKINGLHENDFILAAKINAGCAANS